MRMAEDDAVETTAEEIPPEDLIADAAAQAFEPQGHDVSDADEFKPPAGELVVTQDRDVYRAMDRADEQQILDEIQGRTLREMVYSFRSGGQQVTDLSYGGVREVVRTLNTRGYASIQISADKPEVEEITEGDDTYYRVMVYAYDRASGMGQWGTAVEPKHMKKRDDTRVWDKFALTKALNKAQRNAMKALLPLEFTETIVAQFLGDEERVRHIQAGAGAEKLAEYPPPLDTPEAKALTQQITERYDHLKSLNRLAMLPAVFNEYLTRSAHEIERLQAMLEHVENLIEQEEAKAA